MDLDDVLRVFSALEREGVRYAVFNGLAMAAHGFDRATRDLDLFISPDERNVERLRDALSSVFDDPDIDTITADDLGGDYPAVQYGPPEVDYTIDIVSRLGDAFRFEDLELERVQAGEVTITVITPKTLYRMKRDRSACATVTMRNDSPARSGSTVTGNADMPVTRHRDVAEIPEPARSASALEGIAAACAASSLSRAFGHTRRAPRGVLRFRSIEDADTHRQLWESTPADTDDTQESTA